MRVAQRVIIETQAGSEHRAEGDAKKLRAKRKGIAFLIYSRFALLIRRRCMLVRLTPYAAYIILSDVGRSTYQKCGGDREAECRLRRRGGQPSPCAHTALGSLSNSYPAFVSSALPPVRFELGIS